MCWRLEQVDGKLTKIPYNPRTGFKASPIDPATWSDYNTAVKAASNGNNYSGIGFVLSKSDPYFVIDLDPANGNPVIVERQTQIANSFDTYSEISPSGEGLHLWGKGAIHSGRRREKVEIYSSERYITVTGNTFHDKPIAERNVLANLLWDELGNPSIDVTVDLKTISHPEKYTDELIYNCATQADNGEKFLGLWNGDWGKYYSSQSEADFALINILGFYSRNVAQIRRMFLQSELGKRDKAKRKTYVDNMIIRSFDNLPPLIDLDSAILFAADELAKKRNMQIEVKASDINLDVNPWKGELFANQPDENYDWTRPPGLLGEISQFIYEQSIYPVKEIALGGAIGLMTGICGRAYNVSNTGLNMYTLMLARTGIGKEAAKQGIEKIIRAVRPKVPGIGEFIGPAEVASGPALIKYINKHTCFVAVVGEFGILLEQMHSMHANPSQSQLKRKLLELYNTSGKSDVLRETIYSDKSNNTEIIGSPSFSILGESTPNVFYRSIDDSMIIEGLLPRLTCIEYHGERPEPNDNAHLVKPSEALTEKIETLAAMCLMANHNNTVINVAFKEEEGTTKQAEKMHKALRAKYNAFIRGSDQFVARELWNRAHLKVLKLAALISIGQRMEKPIITEESLEWSRQLVERDILNILAKFQTGKAGKEAGELNQMNEMVNCISDFVKKDYTNFKTYRVDPRMHRDCIIPVSYLQRRLINLKAFYGDKFGATNSINRAIKTLCEEGSIRELRSTELQSKYQTSMRAYFVHDKSRF